MFNFFKLEDNEVLFQQKVPDGVGTSFSHDQENFKLKGIVQSIVVSEESKNRPMNIVIDYLNAIDHAYNKALIYVYANRIEVRKASNSRIRIRGQYYTVAKAKVREIEIYNDRYLTYSKF